MLWAVEKPVNPNVLVLHVTEELTSKTIETSPPSRAPAPLHRVVALAGVRSVDLHRYRARVNLLPGTRRDGILPRLIRELSPAWGPPSDLPEPEPSRPFPIEYDGERAVAESMEMAGQHPVLRALFAIRGVGEAIVEPGRALVRLGRLFSWREQEEAVLRALEDLRE